MPDVYLIDGSAVNDRPDWTNPPAVSASAGVRQETFPGSGVTYTMTPTKRGPRVIVEGWLEAVTSDQLRAKVAAADALRFDTQLYSVEILGTTYANCQLIEPLGVMGKPVGFRREDSKNTVRQKVRYTWQQLSTGGAS